MSHDHAHDHGASAETEIRPLSYALALIVAFMAAEVAIALIAHSLALLSDAAHMLVDAAALGLSVWAARLARRPAGGRMTFGFRRAEILAAQANGATLLLLGAAIVVEALRRLDSPPDVRGGLVLTTAVAGAAVNLARALAGRTREPPQPERRGQLPPPADRPLRVRRHGDRGPRRADDRLRARRPDRLARGRRIDAR